jgi:hypothetical protein
MPWILNCNIYNIMEPQDNVNHSEENQEDQNPNPPQPPNVNTQIDEGLVILRTLEEQLRDTREPSRVSLATSLDIIVKSIASAQGKLTSISDYRERMYEYYSTGLDRNQVKELGISKQQILSIFRDPRNGQELPLTKKHISIDWCIHPQISQNWMDRWYMVFDKPPCNNREMPLYFMRKLWVEFILGKHVNYFDIGEFQGVGRGSAQDREHARCDPVLGPRPPR